MRRIQILVFIIKVVPKKFKIHQAYMVFFSPFESEGVLIFVVLECWKTMGYFEERYNRIWKSQEMSNYLNIHAQVIPPGDINVENNPPWPVIAYAIQANNVTDSIYLSIDFRFQMLVQAYIVLYFMDPLYRFTMNQTSKVEIYVNNEKMASTDVPNGRDF